MVLRRFVRPDWQSPALARYEAAAITTLASSSVLTPELLAVDAIGAHCDVPAVLMTALPGRAVMRPERLEPWLAQLAAQLPLIHETDASAVELPSYFPYTDPRTVDIPKWTRDEWAWRAVLDLACGRQPRVPRRFIHRDYHPGNVLWRRGALSGIVDWVNASIGPPQVDVAHCRLNLVRDFGVEVADRFLAIYQSLTGKRLADYHPFWDAMRLADAATSSLGLPAWARHEPGSPTRAAVQRRLDAFAVAIAARC